MAAQRIIRAVTIILACGLASYWLFKDTVRHYGIGKETPPLRISFWGDVMPYQMWQEMLASFRQRHPRIAVQAEYITDRYAAKIQQLTVTGVAPDVMAFQDEPFPKYVEAGQFEDLPGYLDTPGYAIDLDDFFPSAVESFGRFEGIGTDRTWRMYGIPTEGGCNLIFYNKRCFRRTGVRVASLPGPEGLVHDDPTNEWIVDDQRWTMDEFRQLCRLLTVDGDGCIDQFGFSTPAGATLPSWVL